MAARIHLPSEQVGLRFRFANGTSARIYGDTVVDRGATQDPCVLVVEFRLRLVRGWGHALFRWESLLNTPLFVGFPGFVSKLWMTCDERSRYRGVYEWDGPQQAEATRAPSGGCSRWFRARVDPLPGASRAAPQRSAPRPAEGADLVAWWRPVKVI